MRRWLTATVVGTVAALAMAGCLNPDGVDGDLTDDWAAFKEAKGFVPEADTCHEKEMPDGSLSSYHPVDCETEHEVETLALGNFTGEHADRKSPPAPGSPAMQDAFGECDEKVNKALGADWRSARLTMTVLLPSR